ncbi:MAG UNVERIFIED_CONTAM: hypothetical protein LVR18_33100 [Planctomycetaceae bacterium]
MGNRALWRGVGVSDCPIVLVSIDQHSDRSVAGCRQSSLCRDVRTVVAPRLPLQAAHIPLAFDPADPRLLNFAAPAPGQMPIKPAAIAQQLPGVAAQPVPEPLLPALAPEPDAAAQRVAAEGGIVLRGKRKLADRTDRTQP